RLAPHIFCFQAEDGIRDFHVTGVQTCALPISLVANGGKSKKPEPTPRPGVKAKGKRSRPALSAAQAEAVYRRIHGAPLNGTWQQDRKSVVTHLPHAE